MNELVLVDGLLARIRKPPPATRLLDVPKMGPVGLEHLDVAFGKRDLDERHRHLAFRVDRGVHQAGDLARAPLVDVLLAAFTDAELELPARVDAPATVQGVRA